MISPYYEDQRAGITLYNCDNQVLFQELKSVDVTITDPPYDEKTHKGARYGFIKTSSEIPFAPLANVERLIKSLLEISQGWVVCFCSLEMFGDYKRASGGCWIRSGFWRRPNGAPQFTGDRPGQPGEGIAIMHSGKSKMRWNGNGRHGFWEHCIEQQGRVHPTQKPLVLMTELVSDFTSVGQTILDCYCGSGTTLVAAKELGRKAIGCELSEEWCEIAARRLSQDYLQFSTGQDSIRQQFHETELKL